MYHYYVIALGTDCDGYNPGEIKQFSDVEHAEQYADDQNEWSDGMHYHVVEFEQAQDYCLEFNIDITKIENLDTH